MTRTAGARRLAPAHLSPASRAWWRRVVAAYELEEHHERILTVAAECWDRAAQARAMLDEQGLTVSTDGGGAKTHPAVAIERDSRIGFLRALRELDLDAEAGPDPRPPRRA